MAYYDLPEGSTLKDVIQCIRADESIHRDVNHILTTIKPDEDVD